MAMEQKKVQGNGRLKTSSGSMSVLGKWMGIFSEHYGKEISAVNAAIYERALADLTPSQAEQGCIQALQVCRFMPTVADIRANLAKERKLLSQSDGHLEWEELLDSAKRSYSPDTCHDPSSPNWRQKPKISDAGAYALRCVGGWRALGDVWLKDIPFLRRDFLAAYERFDELEQHRLTSSGEPLTLRDTRQFRISGQGNAAEKLVPMPDEIRKQISALAKK